MRLAGTAGRCFKPGILIKKIRGHHDVGLIGFLLEAEKNPVGHMLGTVLTGQRISNWLLEQTIIIVNEFEDL